MLIFSILVPARFIDTSLIFLYLGVYYFQVSFNLKVIWYKDKITSNYTMTNSSFEKSRWNHVIIGRSTGKTSWYSTFLKLRLFSGNTNKTVYCFHLRLVFTSNGVGVGGGVGVGVMRGLMTKWKSKIVPATESKSEESGRWLSISSDSVYDSVAYDPVKTRL